MLEQTFVHIPGISAIDERRLWSQGCRHWDDFLAEPERFDCGAIDRATVIEVLERSRIALVEGRAAFFRYGLGTAEAWRALPDFRRRCVYLDIETDGGTAGKSITMIGLYDGEEFRCLIRGRDLEGFPEIIARYGMIVTFFGTGFDIPMILKRFPGLKLDQLHLDLCPTLRKLGYRGGLKKIERQLGICRVEEADGLDGMDAIRLWKRYSILNEESALETLISYNREDVVNMARLAEVAYEGLRGALGW